MMKLYSAISPSMNDQWSGKTLRSACLKHGLPIPNRSSTYLTGRGKSSRWWPSAFSSFPEARADRPVEPRRARPGALRVLPHFGLRKPPLLDVPRANGPQVAEALHASNPRQPGWPVYQ